MVDGEFCRGRFDYTIREIDDPMDLPITKELKNLNINSRKNMSQQKKFSLNELLDSVESWLVTGDLNPDILAPDFHFSSPFWR